MTVESDAPSSVMCEVIRVAKLAADGSTPADPAGMYVTDSVVKVSWQPAVEGGLDLTQRKGDGSLGVYYKTPDITKRYEVTVDIFTPDPELESLLTGAIVLSTAGSTVGMGAPRLGQDNVPNGVSIEAWSLAVAGDHLVGTNPYFWWAFPHIKLEKHTARTLEAGMLMNSYEGYMYESAAWGNGPNNDWLLSSDRAWQVQRTATKPTPAIGLQAIPAQV